MRDIKIYLQQILQKSLGMTSHVTPNLCAHIAFQQWLKTYRHKAPKRELIWDSSAKKQFINSHWGKLNILTWPAQGPKILLVHGWNGRASQMGAFAKPLNNAGFEVIAIDLPGHGASSGKSSHLPASAQALLAAQQHFGPFHAIIGHSFGGAASLLAVSEGLKTQALITLGSPSKLEWVLDIYAEFLKFSPTAKLKLGKLVEHKFGTDIWQRCNMEMQASSLTTPGLVIHDADDKEVPYYHAEAVSKAWSASIVKTSGLGHRRILRDNDVIETTVNFIQAQTQTK